MIEKQDNQFHLLRWEFFQWQGKGGDYLQDPSLKLTPGQIQPCSRIRVNVPETLFDAFFPTSLLVQRTPPPLDATFHPVDLWCSGRPVYQSTGEDALMLETDKDSGTMGKEEDNKNGGDVEGKGGISQEGEKDKIDDGQSGKTGLREATSGRGGRLLVRGGYWEVQVFFWFCLSCE